MIILLGLYLEYVLPRQFGKRLGPCFCITCCFPSPPRRARKINPQDEAKELKSVDRSAFEPVAPETAQLETQNEFMKISNLQKKYANGFQAVSGLNVKLYKGQIFCLLGHNGAGKTTTISMLTGLFQQSEGSAELFGVDLFNDMQTVRQMMGVCPQHDILFPLMTVQEHLYFFYELKGGLQKWRHKRDSINKLMVESGIYDKRNALAGTLSGGNKRKLSVCIALVADSRFVVLDEPTSGMDLSARRQLWNMLKAQKEERIVILTTHYMDEADILGDRIGIMTQGRLKALGSSIFLKTKFGVGYNLTLAKTDSKVNKQILPYL